MQKKIRYETDLVVSPEDAWKWITSFDSISKETMPFMKMTTPKDVTVIDPANVVPGQRLFRSWIKIFGLVPIDYSDLTFAKISNGTGFLETSNMGSMKRWQHERTLVPTDRGCKIVDEVIFEPKFAGRIVLSLVDRFFYHRHKMLTRHLSASDKLHLSRP